MLKTYERLIAIMQAYSGLLILVMLATVLVGVFYRYVVDQALSWYDEFAGYILVWVTMYGSVVGLARGKHISFETLVEKFPPRGQRVVQAFGVFCVFGFSLVLLVTGWVLMREMEGETSVSLPAVKMAWIYSAMPISGGLMALIGGIKLVMLFTGREKDVTEAAQAKGMEEAQ